MRIACLQFAPQVGDVDNNLNRADSVLAKANPEDLENLDLLVLPELAFTGYNFKSLNHISPYLEPQGSGISALWARTTALKYNTNVVVGYPERVDVAPKWPTGPEYYNSNIIVNGDGETIANYRKSFLYVIDETWALEGKDGFFFDDIPGLGNTAMGICMDLNPYKFEAPWHAFEFAFHIAMVQANLVIITMAWVTREDGRYFSRMPEEPDMETLTYWVQRLEPLIRTEGQDEVIVIFANRTGTEDDLTYAGTSAVIGIKDEEVNVYGLLGRSVKDLLVVDTDNGPFARLQQRSGEEREIASQVSGVSRKPRKSTVAAPSLPTSIAPTEQSSKTRTKQRRPSPTPAASHRPRKVKPRSPKIHIPENYYRQLSSRDSPTAESPAIQTPTCPSPTPLSQRPSVCSPDLRPTKHHVDTPYPYDDPEQDQPYIIGGRVSINEPTPITASPASGRMADKYFWLGSPPPLRSPMESRFPDVYPPTSSAVAAPVPSSLVNIHLQGTVGSQSTSNTKRRGPMSNNNESIESESSAGHQESLEMTSNSQGQTVLPPRPSSPKSRNASRSGRPVERRHSELSRPDFSAMDERLAALARRPGSAMGPTRGEDGQRQGRSRSRKSSTANKTIQTMGTPRFTDERPGSVSCKEVPFMASPSIFTDAIERPQSDILKNREQSFSRNGVRSGSTRSGAWAGTPSSAAKSSAPRQFRADSTSWTGPDAKPHIEPDETRTLAWSELSKMVGEVLNQPQSREVSRGRHMDPSRFASSDTSLTRKVSPTERSGSNGAPRTAPRLQSQDPANHKPIRTILAPDVPNAPALPYNPDDEIVAEIIFHSHNRPGPIQVNNQGQPVQNAQTNHGTSSPASIYTAMSQHGKGHNTPQAYRRGSSTSMSRSRGRSSQHSFGDIKVHKSPTLSEIKTRPESGLSCPSMNGASVRTEVTPKNSPPTPSPRFFEPVTPKTPKAMKLAPDFGDIPTSASDPSSDGSFTSLDSLSNESVGSGIPRARSAAW